MSSYDIHLRPFEESDLWLVDRAAMDPNFSGPFEWIGFRSPEAYRQRWKEDRMLGKSPYSLCVALVKDNAAVGLVDWRDTDRAGPSVWEIGALIIPDMRGHGIGTAAQSLLVDYLFANTPTHRIWAGTELENIAEQRALEGCGFRQEGLLKGDYFRDGEWRDSYIYAITRPENGNRQRPHDRT
jgi:RimJ/RimL family protein N-acetyltransferase